MTNIQTIRTKKFKIIRKRTWCHQIFAHLKYKKHLLKTAALFIFPSQRYTIPVTNYMYIYHEKVASIIMFLLNANVIIILIEAKITIVSE